MHSTPTITRPLAADQEPFATIDDAGRTIRRLVDLTATIKLGAYYDADSDTLAAIDELAAIVADLDQRLHQADPGLTRRLDDQARDRINRDRDDPWWWI